jgi:hypothetical protein
MKLPRFIGLVDLAVLVVVVAAILLPPRPMEASDAIKGSDADRFALAFTEAQSIASPTSGVKAAELAERIGRAGHKDWSIEAAVEGAERAKGSPDRWRALSAVSVAYIDRLDVRPALDYIEMALEECKAHRDSCRDWDLQRLDLYHQHLDAGVKSGIDPHIDPVGFSKAAERTFRAVRLTPARPQQ